MSGCCKHQVIQLQWRWFGRWLDFRPRFVDGPPDAEVCTLCGEWLSLGPANDESADVAIEMRAAELADECRMPVGALSHRFSVRGAESYGWQGEETIEELQVIGRNGLRRTDRDVPLDLGNPGWQAGYLARCIYTHTRKAR